MASLSDLQARADASPSAQPGPACFVAHLRLFSERLLINRGSAYAPDYRDVQTPLASLCFDYGGTRVRAADERETFFVAHADGLRSVKRDAAGEAQAKRLLEGHGLVELACLDDVGDNIAPDADYVVDLDGDVDALCSFSAHVVPQLRAAGWQVDIDTAYQCQVHDRPAPWYARAATDTAELGWFNLELGIDLDGQRVNLLPVLVELLETSPAAFDLDALARSRRPYLAVPLGGNHYLPVPPARLRRILQVLVQLYHADGLGHDGRMQLPLLQATSLAHLDAAFADTGLVWRGPAVLRHAAQALVNREAIVEVAPPIGLQATLRPYQRAGVSWLEHLARHDTAGILADDMGLGKTLQTIAHLALQWESGRMRLPALVVAPTSLVANWQRELRRFAPHLPVVVLHGPQRHGRWDRVDASAVVLTTYPLLVRDAERFAEHRFHLLVLDEAQTIKSPRSQVHRAAVAVAAEHRLCLTGTPVENSLEELWALFDFLMPGFLGDAAAFRSLYQQPIEKEGSMGRLEALRQRVAPFILRRMKRQVASELPPKTEIVRAVELRGRQRDLYESIRLAAHDSVRRVVRQRGIAAAAIDILDALLKLRQVCCDPRLVAVEGAAGVRESAKLELLGDMLAQMLPQGRRVLVFSQFTSMLALITEMLRRRRVPHVVLTGSTSRRDEVVDAFQNGQADVFLISLKAGGTGLNLTRADTVIHYDPWWNPAVQAQATDRAYRIGQIRPVLAYNLIVAGSVEERILGLQQRKQQLADGLLANADSVAELSEGELDALFAPLD